MTSFVVYFNDMCCAYRGVEEYKPYRLIVLHVLAILICPHFECVDAKIVLALIYLHVHTFSHTIYSRVLASYSVMSILV